VIFLSEEAPSFVVEPGYMEPLNSYISGSNGIDTGDFDRLDFWTRDGKTYGVTAYVQMVMLDYNEAKLKQGGFTDPPKTWDEFHTQALALKSKGVDEYPVAFGAIDWSWYLIALSMGDPMFDDSQNPVFANQGSQGRKAMSLLMDMLTKDKLITPAALSDQTPHAIFMGGVGVFHQSWQGANGLMNNSDKSKQAPNVRYMLMPDQHYTWSLDAAIGISKDSDNKDAAWQFIKWYVTEAQQRAIYDAFGLVPSRKSVQAALNKEGKIAQYDALQEQAKSIHQLPRYTKWWGPWSTKVTEQIRIAAQGSQSADQTVDNIAKAWNDLKAEYTK
jgi:multiple sugar transport system substrate-binding protein